MAGTITRLHALHIGEALHRKFVAEQDRDLLARMVDLYGGGRSLSEVAELVGKPLTTVYRWLRNSGVVLRRQGEAHSGKPWSEARRAATPAKPTPHRPTVSGVALRGYELLSYRATGNRSIDKQGYVVVHVGRKQRQYEHILVAEKSIGRPLLAGEVVHHINCNRADNRPENLLVCTRRYHMELHARMRRDPYWQQVARQAKALTANHE